MTRYDATELTDFIRGLCDDAKRPCGKTHEDLGRGQPDLCEGVAKRHETQADDRR